MQLLRDLLEKIEKANLSNGVPEPEVEVVGVLPDSLKNIYAVFYESGDNLEKLCRKLHPQLKNMVAEKIITNLPPNSEGIDLLRKHGLEHLRHDLIADIFWHSVREAVPGTFLKDVVGIRKGWKIVVFDSPPPHGLTLALF